MSTCDRMAQVCRLAAARFAKGADVYAEQCAARHATFGEGEGRYRKLAGSEGTLAKERPEPTVGSYWPFATTLFDYINRAQSFVAPHILFIDRRRLRAHRLRAQHQQCRGK
jgi:hypothetical protein